MGEQSTQIEILQADVVRLTTFLTVQTGLLRDAAALISRLCEGLEQVQQHLAALELRVGGYMPMQVRESIIWCDHDTKHPDVIWVDDHLQIEVRSGPCSSLDKAREVARRMYYRMRDEL